MESVSQIDILAVGAHPDDQELSCAGTLIRHTSMGYSAGILDLTRGEMGTRGTPEIRRQEALDAAKIIGAKFRVPLDLEDGYLRNDKKALHEVIKIIRASKPKIILANAIRDRHTDHGKGATLLDEAAFLSGLKSITTEYNGSAQDPWRPNAVYHYIQDYYIKPDFVVDISDHIEQKFESILAFKSQFFDPNSSEPKTPISSKEFLDFLRGRAMEMGRPAGFKYGEGFTVNRILGVEDLFTLK